MLFPLSYTLLASLLAAAGVVCSSLLLFTLATWKRKPKTRERLAKTFSLMFSQFTAVQ